MWPGGEEQQIPLRATGAAPAAQAALQSHAVEQPQSTAELISWPAATKQSSQHPPSLPPSSSHFPFSLLFCQLSKLTQSILELKEGQKQCQGGAGHSRPGRAGGYGEHGALPLSSVGQCCPTHGAALPVKSA